MSRALLGLGSNLGDRLAILRAGAARLAAHESVALVAGSRVYSSPPMGESALHEFLNAAVLVETDLGPRELLTLALAVETELGRVRTVRWGPRTLDIDLLWMDGVSLDEPGLTVPHPGLAEREFVLRPAADLLPDLVLPDGRTVAQALMEMDSHACIPLPGSDLGGQL
ncbi:MAG: 2-amino-4-hydroxy-6-hydroxymethyldihydropteridine diphosphokinase [Armatimonadetes bacterium]|nr:2-amino-4-hydroxy-6-hydroxymethyldihydropteridine diphosphokinase [Armatimonadota bacterium]